MYLFGRKVLPNFFLGPPLSLTHTWQQTWSPSLQPVLWDMEWMLYYDGLAMAFRNAERGRAGGAFGS